jgi:hypothetical protein
MVLQIGDRLTAGIRAPTDPAPGETSSHVFRIIIPMACALHMLRDLLSEGLQAGLTESNGNACLLAAHSWSWTGWGYYSFGVTASTAPWFYYFFFQTSFSVDETCTEERTECTSLRF